MWKKFNNKKVIDNGDFKFERALETADRIFYRAFDERVKIGTVMMMDRKMNVLDTHTEAYRAFNVVVKSGGYSWASNKMKNYLENRK